jgi:hypothetical protein
MTEHDWQTASEPHAMLDFLQKGASARKLRLFAVACSRRIWPWIDVLGRAAVEVAESFADGLAGPEQLRAARLACQRAGGQAAWYPAATTPAIAAHNAARSAQAGVAKNGQIGSEAAECLAQAELIRDIFGNPFQPVTLYSSWLTPTVKALPQSIYDERAIDRLPILADELVRSGCDNQDILDHCRGPGPHVRGCWVVDLVLGRS